MNHLTSLKLLIGSHVRTKGERLLWEAGQRAAILRELQYAGATPRADEWPQHPLHTVAIVQFTGDLIAYSHDPCRAEDVCVSFTGSICAIPGKALSAIDLHFGLSGSGGHNTLDMARVMLPRVMAAGLNPRWIVTGCDIVNPLLGRWSYDKAIQWARDNHAGMRALAPKATIIRYGLPPVWDPYIQSHHTAAEIDLHAICEEDGNSEYVSLSSMGALFGLIPTSRCSSDGVHLSKMGVRKLNDMLWDARDMG